MAHFAEINDTGTVTRVVVVHNNITTDLGVEEEQRGIDFLKELLPETEGTWVQTSVNHNFRQLFAGVGWTYDENNDVFVEPALPENET